MSSELVRVGFHGDTLDAVREGAVVWVSLRRLCENLGLSIQGQHKKLLGKSWARINEMLIRDSRGREQPATMIDLKILPGWLFSIDPRKVKEQVREKLAVYQQECADVLADHFFGRTPAPPALSKVEWLHQLAGEMVEQERRLTTVEVGQAELEAEMAEIKKRTGNLLDLIMVKVSRDGKRKVNPRAGLERILDTPRLLEMVYEAAPTHGGVDRALERASGASPGLVHKVIREERCLVVRDGRLVAPLTLCE